MRNQEVLVQSPDIHEYKRLSRLPLPVKRYITFAKQADNDVFSSEQQRFARDKQVELLNSMTKPEWEVLVDFSTWQASRIRDRNGRGNGKR